MRSAEGSRTSAQCNFFPFLFCMHLIGITRLVAGQPDIQRLRASGGQARVFGLLGAARPVTIAALLEDLRGPALITTAHPHTAADLARDLPAWTEWPVSLFPALEGLPYEQVRLDREAVSARERVARDLATGSPRVVVAPARALLQPIEAVINQDAWQARVGAQINLESTLADWLEKGYEAVHLVEDPGTFARRGGVLDVFPTGADKPVRIELFGNEIESLRMFDPASQRSLSVASELVVQPVATLDAEARLQALERLLEVDTSTLNAEALTAWQDGLYRLEAGAAFDDVAMFGPYLIRRPTSVLEHLPAGSLVVVDEARETEEILRSLSEQGRAVQEELEQSGNLPCGLDKALLESARVGEALISMRCIRLFGGSPEMGGDLDLAELFVPARHYASRLRSLVRDTVETRRRPWVIVTFQNERVAELLDEEGVPCRSTSAVDDEPAAGVSLVAGSLPEGWVLPAAQLTVLTDSELFGRARTRPVVRRPRA